MSEKLDFRLIFCGHYDRVNDDDGCARRRDSGSNDVSRDAYTYKQSDPLSNRANIEEKLHSLDYCKQG
jgi:hypothetical protein